MDENQTQCCSYSRNSNYLSYNKRIVFVRRPGANNFPSADCFRCEDCLAPNRLDVGNGQCIVRTLFLSVDPAQRCRMNKSTGVDYLAPYEIGELVDGLEGIGIIEMVSPNSAFKVGDLVTSIGRLWPWSRLFVADQVDLVRVTLPPGFSPSIILSCVGLSGLTALLGIQKKAEIDRTRPQTFVVSGAAGSCGSLAGQIARLYGCTKVIGICGSDQKCAVLLNEWGFNGAINYKQESVVDRLHKLAPEGVDIYFDNVGGFVSDAVISLMSEGGRIVLCGQIAVYNTDLPNPPPLPEKTAQIIAERKIKREKFIVLQYKDDIDTSVAQLSAWLQEKKLKSRETVYEGLERAPEAVVDLLNGCNIGKMIVKVDDS
uniref:Prostaglandin reductase 2 n=1 Tax=Wuchereria bancrofti TaxID=6293 RepID=A0AAF5PYI6_WUCBA